MEAAAAETAAEPAPEPVLCGAITRSGRPCRHRAAQGGRCHFHIVDEIVPDDELEALRQLETAAAQHAIDAHFSNEDGGSGAKDQEFNRNARTAAQLARIRHDLGKPKPEPKDGEAEAAAEPTSFEIDENKRDPEPKPKPQPDPNAPDKKD